LVISAPDYRQNSRRLQAENPLISPFKFTRPALLDDGRVDIDNNSIERAIRPQTITRKNALFAWSEAGGHVWATIASLLATARLNDINPTAWLTLTLQRISQGWPNKQIDELLPWKFKDS